MNMQINGRMLPNGKVYTGWLGPMDYYHCNQPAPFNPDFDHKAKGRYVTVTNSMEADGYYSDHTLEECGIEWARRYAAYKAGE